MPILSLFCLLFALSTVHVSAQDNLAFLLSEYNAPFAPDPVPSDFEHPLLTTVNYATLASPTDIQPGVYNVFNFSRPEGLREFYLYVPNSYGQNKTGMPLAVFFHGYSGSWFQGVYLNLTDVAERMGWLLALGQDTPSNSTYGYLGWNAGSCCLFNQSTTVDDVQYARQLVRTIEAATLVDASRRYALGWSNGAMMSERLACEASDLFAGVAADEGSVVLSYTGVEDSLKLCDAAFTGKRINYLHFHVSLASCMHTPTCLLCSFALAQRFFLLCC